MMVMLSRPETQIALKRTNFRKFASSYGVVNSVFCFIALRKSFSRLFIYFRANLLSFFAVFVSLSGFLTFFCLRISPVVKSQCFLAFFSLSMAFCLCVMTDFAVKAKTVFSRFVFTEFRKQFFAFAMTTSFCYDSFRHNHFLNKWLCLEPASGYIPVSGLLYKVQ